jgi:DNA topoisomerase-6 subunit B
MPGGPVTVMVHMASVWVPFTSESKEAIAGYPEIQRELRLALQAVGRKLAMFLRRRNRVRHEAQRRQIFLRYLGEVADAVQAINGADRQRLLERLMAVAKRHTAEADAQPDGRGGPSGEDTRDFGEHVVIVEPGVGAADARPQTAG